MNTYFIKIRIERDTRSNELLFLGEGADVKKYTNMAIAVKEMKELQEHFGDKAKVLLCDRAGVLVPTTEEDLGELDAIELQQFYSPFLTDEDVDRLHKAFIDENLDDEDYVQFQYSLIHDRLSELGLLE